MKIPEEYRERFDNLARTHPWMREMVDEPCTSEGEKVQGSGELPEGDAVAIMRRIDSFYHGAACAQLAHALGDDRLTAGECLHMLADMIERDYVRRDGYDFTVDALKHMKDERDEWKAKAEAASDDGVKRSTTNLDYLFEHCADFRSTVCSNVVIYDHWYCGATGGMCFEDSKQAHEWLLSLHVDDNDDLPTENGVRADSVDANDANAAQDTREKLEADVRKWCGKYAYQADMVWAWLNRQAAITEREHPGLTISDDESLINWHGRNYLPQSRVLNAERERDEFSLKLKHEMELNRDNRNAHDLERINELTAELAKRQKGVNRLKRRRDELGAKVSLLTAENVALQASVDRLTASCENLARDLNDSERLREELREKLSAATWHAQAILGAMDLGCC